MRIALILSILFSISTFAQAGGIANWKATEGLTEQEALQMVHDTVEEELLYSEDGEEICGVEEEWGWERQPDTAVQFPEQRGPVFVLTGFVNGPHVDMGCSGTSKYDCRVVFSKPPRVNVWGVESVECEPLK